MDPRSKANFIANFVRSSVGCDFQCPPPPPPCSWRDRWIHAKLFTSSFVMRLRIHRQIFHVVGRTRIDHPRSTCKLAASWKWVFLTLAAELFLVDKTLIYYSGRCRVNSAAQHRALICNPLSACRLLINYFPRICPLPHRPEPKARSIENKCDWWSFYFVCIDPRRGADGSSTIDRFSSPSIRKLQLDA